MNERLKKDLDEIVSILNEVKNQGLSYLDSLPHRPTSNTHEITPDTQLPLDGWGTRNTLKYFNDTFEKIMVSSSGPKYWGFVTGGTTPASIAGDWLTTIYDQNAFKASGQGDVSAQIEVETILLLLDLFNLPKNLSGGFVSGATMSNVTCLAAARQWIGKQQGKDLAALPHSSVLKAMSLLGLGSVNIRSIKTNRGHRESMDLHDFEKQILQLSGAPFILISSAGTVNTADFDDFEGIAQLKKKFNFWWHIDAAFGGFASCSKSHRYLVDGWEYADSFTIDCHKWLNVPYENAVFFIKESHKILQVETFQNSNAPYLENQSGAVDYLNLLPENSRRLKALPVWFALLAYGKSGIQEMVDGSIEHALSFGDWIEKHTHFELLAPIRLNTVCFTLRDYSEEQVTAFLFVLNETGKVFMSPTFYREKKGIRAAFVNWRTTSEDVSYVMDLMHNLIKKI
jgi:glutamate/tyrosine decarboxylase-like PLP-dependent enzyme